MVLRAFFVGLARMVTNRMEMQVRKLTWAAYVFVVCASASPLFAQASGERSAAPTQQTNAAPAPTSGWRDGFILESADGSFRLQVGGLLQADARFAPKDDDQAVTDTFLLRRVRPYLRGRIARRFEFYFNPDFAGGTLAVQEAYLDTIFAPAFRIRIGKAKSPFGLERLHSSNATVFFERAFPTSVAPNRDIGIQVLGDVAGGRVSYHAGVMNGVPDGGSADLDTNDGKDVVGRVVVRPFTANAESPLRGLSLALAGSRGRQEGAAALPAFRTPSLQQPYFSYVGAASDGVRTRYSPQASFTYKSFGSFAEYVHSEMPIAKSGAVGNIAHDARQIAVSFVLTGEPASGGTSALRPRASFDPDNGHFGAFQLAARYHALEVDDQALARGLAATGASRKAEAWTLGLNWYLTQNLRYTCNFERTVFDDDAEGARAPENALVFRGQVSF